MESARTPQVEEADEQDLQLELQMLTEECQDLLSKLLTNSQGNYLEDTTELCEESTAQVKLEKTRLEKEYIELCIEIERQQKQLESYKHKIEVTKSEADYYSRQIKEKEAILYDLEKHQFQVEAGARKKGK